MTPLPYDPMPEGDDLSDYVAWVDRRRFLYSWNLMARTFRLRTHLGCLFADTSHGTEVLSGLMPL